LGKVKQWFYANKDRNTTWNKCSTAFLAKFFSIGKTNAEEREKNMLREAMCVDLHSYRCSEVIHKDRGERLRQRLEV
jgi:hypothetical protein